MNYVLSDTKEQVSLLDAFYPIGSYYITESETSPASLFGGAWEKLEDKMLIGAGDHFSPLSEGGGITATLGTNELPKHSHTRGDMEITGAITGHRFGTVRDGVSASFRWSGALYGSNSTLGATFSEADYGGGQALQLNFQASKNWTGSTSEAGKGEPFSIMNPYRAVYIWRRIEPKA